jgi:glutathione S-transferase
MTDITLFIAPGSCSRVPLIALAETGQPFETRVVRFLKGEHKSPDYKRMNPKGKVPAIVVDGAPLTENVAIIAYLNRLFPAAELLPPTIDPLEQASQIADLCFCSATLHPLVTRIRMSHLFAAPEAVQSVWEKGAAGMREYFELIEDRLAAGDWWYGARWSAMDAYLYWVFWRVEGANFDVTPYPHFTAHARRMEARPSVQRALAIEAEAAAQLEAEGLTFIPPPPPVAAPA